MASANNHNQETTENSTALYAPAYNLLIGGWKGIFWKCKMTINGVDIRKYRARVKARNAPTTAIEPISEDGYKIVEGYVSIAAVDLSYGSNEPRYVPIFVAEEMDLSRMFFSGLGRTLMHPMTYNEGEFEIIGVVD